MRRYRARTSGLLPGWFQLVLRPGATGVVLQTYRGSSLSTALGVGMVVPHRGAMSGHVS
jgi:hypothetical protein